MHEVIYLVPRSGFVGDFVSPSRRNKSCFSCIKFVVSTVKLLVYMGTLLINQRSGKCSEYP